MAIVQHLALLGIVPFVLVMFMVLTPRRAVLVGYLAGWLFLPMGGYSFEGIPDYDKITATAVPVFLGMILFDSRRLLTLRLHWFDLPIILWCLYPVASSLTNDFGLYDGISGSVGQTLKWGLPYLMGRLYFTDQKSMHDLAMAMLIGGLIYVPLCLWEARMSPQLHNTFYGYHQHQFVQHIRGSGYRPMVFMQHGLAVGLWMAAATVAGFVLWWGGTLRRIGSIPMPLVLGVMMVTLLLCRSIGALMLFMIAVGIGFAMHWVNPRWLLIGVLLIAPLYVGSRITVGWADEGWTDVLTLLPMVSEDRAGSFGYRLHSENELLPRAWERPLFGWSRIDDAIREGQDGDSAEKAVDSMWIITFGQHGLGGLLVFCTLFLLPLWAVATRIPPALLRSTTMASVIVVTLVLNMYLLDLMLNAMFNPVFFLMIGGLTAFAWNHDFRRVVLPDARSGYVMVPRGGRTPALT